MKKYINNMMLLGSLIAVASCTDLKVDSPELFVSIDLEAVTAGEEVTFQIDGSPEFLTFFSGEEGSQYKHKARTIADGVPAVSFGNVARYGAQENTLAIMVSSDYSGAGNSASLDAATWTDITSSFTLNGQVEPDPTVWDFVQTDTVDLSAFKEAPVYFAFKYKGLGGETQRTWRISDNFKINLTTTEGEVINVADINNPGFGYVDVEGEADIAGKQNYWRWDSSNSYWEMKGGNAAAPDNEDWLISSGPIDLTAVSPDNGTAQNSYTDKVEEVTHTYSKPGTYTATFIGINASVEGSKEVVHELTIEVVE